MKTRAIFLDRDGVLNEAVIKNGKPYPPATVEEVVVPNAVAPALLRLQQANFLLIVVTNQPDIARKKTSKETVAAINTHLCQSLPLDAVYVCSHDDNDACLCRKPKAGLLTTAAKEYNIDLKNSFMLGDRGKDITAGQNAGCRTVWLNMGYDEAASPIPANFTTTDIRNAVDWILQQEEI